MREIKFRVWEENIKQMFYNAWIVGGKMFKRLFCKHDYKHIRNIHGDEINLANGKRSIWKCSKCGKIKLSGKLHQT